MSEGPIMTSWEYEAAAKQLCLLGHLSLGLDLSNVLNLLNLADTIGPIVDPTAYRAGMRNVQDVRDLAEALQPFQDAARRLLRASPPAPSTEGGERDAIW